MKHDSNIAQLGIEYHIYVLKGDSLLCCHSVISYVYFPGDGVDHSDRGSVPA